MRWAGRVALETPDLELAELAVAVESLHALPDEHARTDRARRARPPPARPSGPATTLGVVSQPPPSPAATAARAAQPPEPDPCPWCGARRSLLWIRSHVQCAACGQVVESCCEGPAGCA